MLSSEHAASALYATGHWLLGQQRWLDAAQVFRLMTASVTWDERGWLGLGAAHEGLGQLGIAAELYRLSVTVGPFARCALARGRVLAKLGDEVGSEQAYDAALEAATALGLPDVVALVHSDRSVA